MRYLAVDFGSTYTKLTAVDSTHVCILGTASAFTTITTDIYHGFSAALHTLQENIGAFAYDTLLCCSSAGGGLTMVALGLVPELTAQAAKMAAESAGAKVMRTYAYAISPQELEEIADIRPDIILVCGGTDGGNTDVILYNTQQLCSLPTDFAIIVAGNKSALSAIEPLLRASQKRFVITKNVMPRFGVLDIEPARECIRQIFIDSIIEAKGLSNIQSMTPHPIIPTPLAVLKACELLACGTQTTPGIGDFMALDVGGATTDVYSLATGAPTELNVCIKGLPEPYAKRTVEGDLGMRYSMPFLLEEAGAQHIAHATSSAPEEATAWVAQCSHKPETCSTDHSRERRLDEALASAALSRAMQRHCGILEKTYSPMGELFILTGKDLRRIPRVIGIGGILQHSVDAKAIFANALQHAHVHAPERMLPHNPHFCLDRQYIFSAMGLLSTVEPEAALHILKNSLHNPEDKAHGTA